MGGGQIDSDTDGTELKELQESLRSSQCQQLSGASGCFPNSNKGNINLLGSMRKQDANT